MHVKKGEKVKILAGKEKGKTGTIISVLREKNRVVVEGLNMMKHHVKAKKAGEKGGIVEIAHSIHASNVASLDKKTKEPKATKEAKPKAVKKTAKAKSE